MESCSEKIEGLVWYDVSVTSSSKKYGIGEWRINWLLQDVLHLISLGRALNGCKGTLQI